MRVSDPLTAQDRIKIALLFPFVIVAAVILGVFMRVVALGETVAEWFWNR